ncbi:MAG: hypothetical protein IKU65_06360 [Oscillospiraceae bacterium]|nr:hypothetical protein [Oscillospiraceae bacterium]
MPEELKFNRIAAKGGKLHSLIKENKYPFYVDRIAGGCTYHKYDLDRELVRYIQILKAKTFRKFPEGFLLFGNIGLLRDWERGKSER